MVVYTRIHLVIVSIHTPTQGVTLASYSLFWWYTSFNPHTHAGCDKEIWMRSLRNGLFQSTHPRRVWLMEYFHNTRVIGFNPHTHAGCDLNKIYLNNMTKAVSIHTPTQGVTRFSNKNIDVWWFQSTHPRRVWQRSGLQLQIYSGFQSTHPRRVWLPTDILRVVNPKVSIHTPTQGVTTLSIKSKTTGMFQSTHPRRVWHFQTRFFWRLPVSIHTPTQGVTKWNFRRWSVQCFNPHTHAGCDSISNNIL